jgi:DNA-binding NarL/FixJ family response regulator
MTVRVLIADDQELVRASFRLLIESAPDLDVVGEAGSGGEALALARSTQPDVVVMDVRMPGMDGIEATRLLSADPSLPQVRVLMLTTFDLDDYVYAALRAGASGFLLKDTSPAALLAGIRTVASGEGMLAPTITRRLIEEFSLRPESGPASARRLDALTEREREVLVLISRGLSNTELAAKLYISMATVKTHISRLLAKLHARDRAQLVIAAYETGLVGPGRFPGTGTEA